MQIKDKISPARKTLYVIMLFGIFFSAFGMGNLPAVRAQEGGASTAEVTQTPLGYPAIPTTPIATISPTQQIEFAKINPEINFGSYVTDMELRDIIFNILLIRPPDIFDGTNFGITYERTEGNWKLLSIVSLDGQSSSNEVVGQGNLTNLIIARIGLDGKWDVALSGTQEFSDLIKEAPNSLISNNVKDLIDPLNNNVNTAWVVSYKFPWAPGNWEYRQGWHQGTSIDIGTSGDDKRVLAAADGLITGICKGQLSANVSIRHWDGNTLQYFHIDVTKLGAGIEVGKEVLRGQTLGSLRPGTWSLSDDTPAGGGTACGYTVGQSANSAHIHWIIPNSLIVDGWSITSSDSTWRKGNETRIPTFPYQLLSSTNYVIAKQYEYKSTWLNASGGWPYLFVLDPKIRQFTIDGSNPYTFDGSCNSAWVNLSPGDHLLVELYEVRDSNAPTINLKPWPVLVPPVCAGEPTDPPTPPSDTTPPVASWSAPVNGQTISSRSVTLSANASDNTGGGGVRQVDFSAKWGGVWRSLGSDTSAPYSLNWDMCNAGVPNGDIELGLEAWDNAGNHWVYSALYANYHINKSFACTQGTDTTPPTVSWTSPSNGQTISSQSVTLSANASDNSGGSGVREVRWSAKWNNTWYGIGSDTTAPYSTNWDMCAVGVPNGDIELGMEVWDNANNKWVYSEHYTNYHINKSYTCTGTPSGGWETWGWQNSYLAGYDNWHGTVTWDNYPYIWWDFGSAGPFGWGGDDFSLRMQRDVYFPGGDYSFHVDHDDGARVYLDGQLIIDAWWDGNGGHDAGRNIPAGNHQVKVEFYEKQGDAVLHVLWYGPGFPRPDTNPPDGRITSPVNFSATASSPLTITADASDDASGVNRVEFYVWYCDTSCSWRLIGTDYTSPYAASWDWSALTDQHVYLTTHMVDNTGKVREDPGGYVEVDLDRGTPTASITNPLDAQMLIGTPITISVDAADSLSGIGRVQFFAGYSDTPTLGINTLTALPAPAVVDGIERMMITEHPEAVASWHELGWDTNGSDGWSLVWNPAAVPDQAGMSVFVYAYDKAGNYQSATRINLSLYRPPSNDDINTPIQIGAVPAYTNQQNTTAATVASDDPAMTACGRGAGDSTVWYKFLAPASGQVHLDTLSSDYDTVLAVWSGARGSLVSVGCNDDTNTSLQSSLNVNVNSGVTYYIEIAQYKYQAGTLQAQSQDIKPTFENPSVVALNQTGGNLKLNFTYSQTLTVNKIGTGSGTVTSSPSGINCGSTCSYAFAYNTIVTLAAVPTTNHTFSGWSGACTGTGTCTVNMSSAQAVTANFRATPGDFYKSSPANGATNQPLNLTLSWGSSIGATSYEYCYDTTNDYACASWINNGTSTSKALSGLSETTTYYWHVRAVNSFGTTYSNRASTAFQVFTTQGAPKVFYKSAPTNGATNQLLNLTLSWGSSMGATSYEYCYDTTNDYACASWVNNGTSTNKALSGLRPNTTYYWHVRAINIFGTTYSNVASTAFQAFTTGGDFYKSAPAKDATSQPLNLTLSWGSSMGATSYEYCYDTTNDYACTNWINNGTSTSKALSGLRPNTTYYWHVRAVNNFGIIYSNRASTAFQAFTTGGDFYKSAPTNGATNQLLNLTLSWGSSMGATSYEYCYDTTNDYACANWVNNGTSTSKALSGLSTSTTYYWHVRAVNNFGIIYSNRASTAFQAFTTGGDFYKSSPASGAISQPLNLTLSWGPSIGATSYEYCYDTTNDYACTNWISNGTSTSKVLSGLSAGTTYYWHVRAINSGATIYSNRASTAFQAFTTVGIPKDFYKNSPAKDATSQPLNLTLSWGSSTDAVSYEYCYDTTNDYACTNWINNGASTSKALSGLSAGTKYYWHVRAVNNFGTTYSNRASTAFQAFTTGQSGGRDIIGIFRPSNGLLILKDANATGFTDVAIGDYPVAGDWDGNGTDTVGIYRNGSFYLRNSNTLGSYNLVFAFGQSGDQPVVGDWDGDGIDTIGVYRNGLFLLRNSNSAGAVDITFALGNPGDVGIAGDWNGDGMDTTGVFRPSNGVIFLKNVNSSGFADIALNYGLSGDQPVIGDWNNDGIDTIGVYRNAQFLLRNSNTIGFADIVFALGNPGDIPIAGNWNGLP